MNIIEAIIALVDDIIANYVFAAFTDLSPTIEALWRILFIIFIAWYGYRVIFSGQFNLNDLFINTLKIVVVLVLATTWGTFSVFFYDSFTQIPNEVAGRVLSGTATSVGGTTTAGDTDTADNALGSFFIRGMASGNSLVEDAGWTEIGKYFYAICVWIVTTLLTAYALMLIVISKLAVAILLAVAPVFILLLMFSASRGFFEGWFRALVNYAIIPIFVYSLLALVLRIAEGPLSSLEANATLGQQVITYIAPFALVAVIGFVLMTQIPTMAAGVAGGFALSTMGFAGNMARRISGAATGGRVGREAREALYLRSTRGMQRALSAGRGGGTGSSVSAPRTLSPGSGGGSSTPKLSAGTPSGAAPSPTPSGTSGGGRSN